jgi:hypothetical protein
VTNLWGDRALNNELVRCRFTVATPIIAENPPSIVNGLSLDGFFGGGPGLRRVLRQMLHRACEGEANK